MAARDAGILSVVSSGNDGHGDGLTDPACVPEALSVGAVYDADAGQVSYSDCSDASTAPDQVSCFSNSAHFLSALAPGALITAAGLTAEEGPGATDTLAGTSMAAPHGSGLAALLAAADPGAGVAAIEARMLTTGKPVTDPRNGLVFPRTDALAALDPPEPDEDIPFLPWWALAGLGGLLAVLGTRRGR